MTVFRIGVVGLGAIAQSVHLPLLSRRWDLFEIAAVADASPRSGRASASSTESGPGTGTRASPRSSTRRAWTPWCS
ncbi:hypothetical protein [Sinomonas atrocyanea]